MPFFKAKLGQNYAQCCALYAKRLSTQAHSARTCLVFRRLLHPILRPLLLPHRLRMHSASRKISLFDVCHIGIVLRAVLLVQLSTGLATLLSTSQLSAGLLQYALLTCASLPALLTWLLLVCAAQNILDRMVPSVQWCISAGLGFLCGLASSGLYTWVSASPLARHQWLSAGLAGLSFACVLMTLLAWRQKASHPAATVAKLAELQSRIRPHFLFNTLNSAIALIQDEPHKAEQMLQDLSDLFHHALKDPNSQSSLEKEIEIAKLYLDIEKIRFEDRLTVHWHISEEALQASLPPLILQPLVENAIKHGIEPSAEGGEVHIWVKKKGTKALVRIHNSLPTRSAVALPTAGNGMALKNIRMRLQLMHDVNAFFYARKKPNAFEVDFSVPLSPLPVPIPPFTPKQ